MRRTALAAAAIVALGVLTAVPPSTAQATTVAPRKVLTFVLENHSLSEMQAQMPYLNGLAAKYSYATNWTAISHPSLPNYLALFAGSTFGITDDRPPADHPLAGNTVFDAAILAGKHAKTYAESMPGNCSTQGTSLYAVRHNPWLYFTSSGNRCLNNDVPFTQYQAAATGNALPAAGAVVPNLCSDAHDCSLTVADNWLKAQLPYVLNSADFTSGKVVVVVTADEDDRTQGNKVLTVVMHAGTPHRVVTTALTHYSLTRYYAQVNGTTPLCNAATAPDMRAAFGL